MSATFKAPVPTHEKLAAGAMLALQRGDAIQDLNDDLYAAARTALSCWERGDLAAAMRQLQDALDEIDDHHDEVAAIESGWERQGNTWIRFTTAGESLDPELNPTGIWIADGMIHALRAEDALTQDSFRDLPRA